MAKQKKYNVSNIAPLQIRHAPSVKVSLLIVFCIPVLLYLQTISFGFSYFDDDNIIVNNKAFLGNIRNCKQAFRTDAFVVHVSRFYRPLQTISFIIDTRFTKGTSAAIYHLSNVLLLGFIACVLFLLLKRFLLSTQLAIIGSLFYCTHPLFVSTVAWIPARGDLLLTLCSMLSFLFFVDYVHKQKLTALMLNWLSFTLTLLCKETAIVLPFLFVGYYFAFVREKRFNTTYLLLTVLYAISIVLWYWLRTIAIGNYQSTAGTYGVMSILANSTVLLESITKFILPYDFSPIPQYSLLKMSIGLVISAASIFVLFKNNERPYKEKLFWGAWFVALLVPTMLYKGVLIDYLDHRFFLPLIGVLVLLLYLFPKQWLHNGTITKPWILIVVIVLFATLTFIKSRLYQNPMTYYNAAIAHNPHSAVSYYNRGILKTDAHDNLGAIDDYTKAITICPIYSDAYLNRGVSLSNLDKNIEAINDYSKAIELSGGCQAYYNRGVAKSKLGDNVSALADYTKAITLYPTYREAYHNRGLSYMALGDTKAAIDDYTKAIAIKADDVDDYINRGTVKANMGDKQGAIADYTKAIAFRPDFAEAYNNRGIAKANLGDRQSAIADYTKAITLNENFADAYNNRGISFSYTGNYSQAIEDFTKAIAINPNYFSAYTNRSIASYSLK